MMKKIVAGLVLLSWECWALTGGIPRDAIVLFDGTQKSLDANWGDVRGRKTKWKIVDGAVEAVRGAGNLCTRRVFGDVQFHCEWRTPENFKGVVDNRGNSGVFFGNDLYEVQVFESFATDPKLEGRPEHFKFYSDGIAAAIYGQNPPLVNATLKAGQWQTYDIVYHAPRFNGNTCLKPGSLTVFLNGVLVQDHWELEGPTWYLRRTRQVKPGGEKTTIQFQDHSCPVRYRNVWVRELKKAGSGG